MKYDWQTLGRFDRDPRDQAEFDRRRKAYVNNPKDNQGFYLWLADWIGLTEELIPHAANGVDPEQVELRFWEVMHCAVQWRALKKLSGWLPCDTVGCLKAMAKRRRDK